MPLSNPRLSANNTMAVTLSSDQFFEVVRKSKLLDEKRLEEFLRESSASLPTNSRDIAQQMVRQGLLTTMQATQLLQGRFKGFILAGGKYKLLERLGAGGMGQVFLCEHIRMKRLVALKVLPTERLKDDQTALERFDREARAAAALDHENIVRAHDIDTDGKMHFLVMEYVDGSSLHEIVKKHGPLDIVRACHYIAQAAAGLQHAHEAGWVHRDIKPGNLLLDRSGTIKILDMGLARLFAAGDDDLTKRHEKDAVLGTADYLAPEQARNSSDVDIRADIYSLGATFFYLLTGRAPFDEGTITQKLIWHQSRQPESLRNLRPDLPKELEAIVNKMMAKKEVHRYQEPDAIVDVLRPWTDKPIEPPANEEMPRMCPALENFSTGGATSPASGKTSLTGIRVRGRSGPRSSSTLRSAKTRLRPTVSPAQSKWLAIGGGALAGVLVLSALTYWLTRSPDKPTQSGGAGAVTRHTTPATHPATPPKGLPIPPATSPSDLPPRTAEQLYVTRNPQPSAPSRGDVFPSLSAALAKAKAGQTIVVLEPEIHEQVSIDGRLNGLRIESGLPGGQAVVWRARTDGAPDVPLLRLEGAGAFSLRGFTMNGGHRIHTLIRASGACSGMRLSDLTLTDAVMQSCVLADCVAPTEQPLTIEQIRFTTLHDYSDASQFKASAIRPAAVWCTNAAQGNLPHFVIRLCRFEGMFRSAVAFEGPAQAEIRLNRFYTLRTDERPPEARIIDAVNSKVPAQGAIRLALVSNTMSRFTNLLKLDKLPPAASESRFVLRNNLVMGAPGDAWVFVPGSPSDAAAKPFFVGSEGNVTRPHTVTKGLGNDVIPRKYVDFKFIDVALKGDQFLRYKRTGDTAPLLTAGAGGEPVGVPPLD